MCKHGNPSQSLPKYCLGSTEKISLLSFESLKLGATYSKHLDLIYLCQNCLCCIYMKCQLKIFYEILRVVFAPSSDMK